MESTPIHVVSTTIDIPEQWKAMMVQCHLELTKLIDLGVKVMVIIQWRTNYDYIQPQEGDVDLGSNPLLLQATILRTQHLG
jgi:hypothetical protein